MSIERINAIRAPLDEVDPVEGRTVAHGTSRRKASGANTTPAPASPADRGGPPSRDRRPGWQRTYQRWLVANDLLMAVLSTVLVTAIRWRLDAPDILVRVDGALMLFLPVLWVALLALRGAYDRAALGFGVDEFRRVLSSGAHLLAILVLIAFALNSDLSRLVVFGSVFTAVLATVLGRHILRRVVHGHRAQGDAMHQVLVVGMRDSVRSLTEHFDRAPQAGYAVAGACVPFGSGSRLDVGTRNVPVLGSVEDIESILTSGPPIDVLAIADTGVLSDGELRELAWGLADTGVDLVVAPAIVDLAGPRISVKPVAGLPLLHVDEPHLSGPKRVLKLVVETCLAAVALVLLSPVLLVCALAVKLSGPGPIIFKQERAGLDGRPFKMWKFRSMVQNAEELLPELQDRNEHDGLLFKIADDPRITGVGRVLRRYSLDELPQLVNVVQGHMALVGPRPHLPSEVERYDDSVRRRLLVRPGATGLWQVSGRADLSWPETVRLDVYYVDNWSLTLDAVILAKTVSAVLRRRGAY